MHFWGIFLHFVPYLEYVIPLTLTVHCLAPTLSRGGWRVRTTKPGAPQTGSELRSLQCFGLCPCATQAPCLFIYLFTSVFDLQDAADQLGHFGPLYLTL